MLAAVVANPGTPQDDDVTEQGRILRREHRLGERGAEQQGAPIVQEVLLPAIRLPGPTLEIIVCLLGAMVLPGGVGAPHQFASSTAR